MGIISEDFLIVYQIFFSPKVKRSVLISNEHSICELPHELSNNLRLAYNMGIISEDLLTVYQIFFSPQVKRRALISNEHSIYEVPHKLPNNLRLKS